MTIVDFANKFLGLGVIVSQIFILVVILCSVFFRKQKNVVMEFVGKYGLLLAFLFALISMLGSLFYSQIVGFPPCDLCWFQRIFMYPLVFVLGLALIKKHHHIADYGLVLAIIGGLISLYHNYMYYYNQGLDVFCQLGGQTVSCVKRYVFEFGYITIPMMALTGFALIITFLIAHKIYVNHTR